MPNSHRKGQTGIMVGDRRLGRSSGDRQGRKAGNRKVETFRSADHDNVWWGIGAVDRRLCVLFFISR